MRRVHKLKAADASTYMTIEEASTALDVKGSALRNYLCDGKLTTYKFKTLTLVKAEEVIWWRDRQRTR